MILKKKLKVKINIENKTLKVIKIFKFKVFKT